MESASTLDSLFGEPADVPLTIGKRDLERVFQSILEQLANHRLTNSPLISPIGERNAAESCARYPSKNCCCEENIDEMPSFSVSFGNPSCCSTNGTTHNISCRTASNQRKVLQIHLPESSKEPCQILITSHRDQVSVKYLKQGQKFTFSTNNTVSHEGGDQVFSNTGTVLNSKAVEQNAHANHVRENEFLPNEVQVPRNYNDPNIQNTNPLGIVIQDVMSQQEQNVVISNNVSARNVSVDCMTDPLNARENEVVLEEDKLETSNDIGTVSSLNEHNARDGYSHDHPRSKKQRKQSLKTFFDYILDKRSREASRKDLDEKDQNLECVKIGEKSFETPDATCGTKTMTGNVVIEHVVNDEPASSLFPSEALKEPTGLSISTHAISNSSLVVEDSQSMTTVIPALNLPTDKTMNDSAETSRDEVANKPTVKKGRFKCQYCSELFQQRSQCLLHISRQHVEERPHHCPLCDATFKKRRSLKYHIRHHNGERPFKCTYCDKAFKEKYHLTVHIRTHTGERPFACTQCGKAFKQTNELTSHIRTHTGERPYKCNLCDKWFKRKGQLYNHNLSHLPEPEHVLESVNVSDTEMASIK